MPRVTPTGQSEYSDGNEVGRYGRDGHDPVFVWYHCGLRKYDEPAWAMATDVEFKLSVSVDTIYVPDKDDGLFAIDREGLAESVEVLDGQEQHVVRASDECVSHVGEPADFLRGNLWIESGNQVDEGYHKQANEA